MRRRWLNRDGVGVEMEQIPIPILEYTFMRRVNWKRRPSVDEGRAMISSERQDERESERMRASG